MSEVIFAVFLGIIIAPIVMAGLVIVTWAMKRKHESGHAA